MFNSMRRSFCFTIRLASTESDLMAQSDMIHMLLWGVAFPLVFSFLATLIIWWGQRGEPVVLQANPWWKSPMRVGGAAHWRIATTGVVCVGLVFIASQAFLHGTPAFPPREALHLLPFALAVGVVIGLIELFVPVLASRVTSIVVIGVAVLLSTSVKLPKPWIGDALVFWAVGWSALKEWGYSSHRSVGLVTVGTFAAGAVAVLVTTGNLKLAQLSGALAFALLGIFVASRVRPLVAMAGPALGGACAVLGSLVAQGIAYGDTPRQVGYTYALGAPVLTVLIVPIVAGFLKPKLRPWLAGAIPLVLAGGVAAWAMRASSVSESGY